MCSYLTFQGLVSLKVTTSQLLYFWSTLSLHVHTLNDRRETESQKRDAGGCHILSFIVKTSFVCTGNGSKGLSLAYRQLWETLLLSSVYFLKMPL